MCIEIVDTAGPNAGCTKVATLRPSRNRESAQKLVPLQALGGPEWPDPPPQGQKGRRIVIFVTAALLSNGHFDAFRVFFALT